MTIHKIFSGGVLRKAAANSPTGASFTQGLVPACPRKTYSCMGHVPALILSALWRRNSVRGLRSPAACCARPPQIAPLGLLLLKVWCLPARGKHIPVWGMYLSGGVLRKAAANSPTGASFTQGLVSACPRKPYSCMGHVPFRRRAAQGRRK